METRSIARTTLYHLAGYSLALLFAAGSVAFAHGGGSHNGGDHFSNGGHGRCIDCGGKQIGGRTIDSGYWHHHRHHHHHHHTGTGPGGLGTVHGPGSSHNPIVYHPGHGPVVRDHRRPVPAPVVRDHRTPPPVRDHRKPSVVRDHRMPHALCGGPFC